jgi:hypothetical protein
MYTEQVNILRARAEQNKRTSVRYHGISTEMVVENLGRILTDNGYPDYSIRFKKAGSARAKTTQHFIRVQLGSANLIMNECRPEIVLRNSFNGEGALVIQVGLYRLICSNGLTVGQEWFSESVRHVRGPKMNTFLEEFEQKIVWALKFIAEVLPAKIEGMKAIKIGIAKQIEIVESLNLSAMAKEQVRAMRIRPEDSDDNAWTLYNRINEVVRLRSRSEFANERKNVGLMDEVLRLAA